MTDGTLAYTNIDGGIGTPWIWFDVSAGPVAGKLVIFVATVPPQVGFGNGSSDLDGWIQFGMVNKQTGQQTYTPFSNDIHVLGLRVRRNNVGVRIPVLVRYNTMRDWFRIERLGASTTTTMTGWLVPVVCVCTLSVQIICTLIWAYTRKKEDGERISRGPPGVNMQ
jgi:hypothetical protein